MNFSEIYKITLVLLLIVCAVSVNLTRSLLRSVIIFMSYSSIMCLLWVLMESPDLAITEAAVGAGISGYLFLVTLKKLRQIDAMDDRQSEGGAWTDTAPEMEPEAPAAEFPDGGVSQQRPNAGNAKPGARNGKRKRSRAKRKEGGA